MLWSDPYPETELLTLEQVAKLLGMRPRTFREFRKHNPGFPQPQSIGKTKHGKDILRWAKLGIYFYLDQLGSK